MVGNRHDRQHDRGVDDVESRRQIEGFLQPGREDHHAEKTEDDGGEPGQKFDDRLQDLLDRPGRSPRCKWRTGPPEAPQSGGARRSRSTSRRSAARCRIPADRRWDTTRCRREIPDGDVPEDGDAFPEQEDDDQSQDQHREESKEEKNVLMMISFRFLVILDYPTQID